MSAPWPVHWRETVDSTNEEAKRLARAGGFSDHWIAAREQTAGRGRLGRGWASPPGNLYCTALFHEPGGMAVAGRAPFIAAVAVSDVFAALSPGADVRLKWPNDVRWDGRKLCGVLIEAGSAGDVAWVATGIGINVTGVPEAAGQAASSLADLRGDTVITADQTLETLRERFEIRLSQGREDFAGIIDAWLARAEGLGQMVRVSPGGAPVEGIFEGLEPDGALVLRLATGEAKIVRAGDVELVRELD